MTTCILGCQYIPSAEYFAHWLHHGEIHMEAHENYQKRTWRNRTCILSPGDPLSLTVPLQKGKHQQQDIREVQIAYDEPWPEKHIRSLQTAFGNTAFGEEVLEGLFEILKSENERLWDLNLLIIEHLTSLLSGKWTYRLTFDFKASYPNEVVDLRKGIPAGESSIPNEALPVYQQVQRLHQSFQPNLTILDALCHLGPGTMDYLARYAAQLYPTS